MVVEGLRDVLGQDVSSHCDARFLSPLLRERVPELSADSRTLEGVWAHDEEAHFSAFVEVCSRLVDCDHEVDAVPAASVPEFSAPEPLLADEFRIGCLGAYDEFTTERPFTAFLALRSQLDPKLARFVRQVIADGARHYCQLLRHVQQGPRQRSDLDAILTELRKVEGTPYATTFFLDHDDEVSSGSIRSAAERALMRRLA